MTNPIQHPTSTREWLEADGLGGFASGTSTGIRTRRYHALLLAATTPPTGRMVLVNGFDAWAQTARGTFSLSSQCYAPDVIAGDGAQRIESFAWDPWPRWVYKLEEGTCLELEVFALQGQPTTCLSWKLLGPPKDVTLHLRPFLSGRDYHALHKGNTAFRFEAEMKADRLTWQPYADVPGVTALTNGAYHHQPLWYYNFLYEEERARGLDSEEDLAAPGILSWNLAQDRAALVLTTGPNAAASFPVMVKPVELLDRLRQVEQQRRQRFPSRLDRAADAYIVKSSNRSPVAIASDPIAPRPNDSTIQPFNDSTIQPFNDSTIPRSDDATPGTTVIAGYPWFTDWGRDTLIALRGLCLATGRLDAARDILLAWSAAISEGMLPNRFPDQGGQPEFNTVDASLWFVIAVHEFFEAAQKKRLALNVDRTTLLEAVETILQGYSQGTRYGIRADSDGLLACGVPGVQLTWMDAKVGDWVVTPRMGKPVEVQALWLNALWVAGRHNPRWEGPLQRGLDSFRDRFWNPQRNMLYDVVDANHQPGAVDASFRPNQILAAGGLPLRLLQDSRAGLVVEAVHAHLWTPLGLRSLAPGEPGYVPHYQGGVRERDGAYHQGTVWPWLLGAFVDAWIWVHRQSPDALGRARRQFLQPLLDHLEDAGLGHISEIADAEAPHTPRGCPWQAWSVGEALWLDRMVLGQPVLEPASKTPKAKSDVSFAPQRTGKTMPNSKPPVQSKRVRSSSRFSPVPQTLLSSE